MLGEVATNSFGANMPTGHTSALARAGATPYAVLEVDEHYLAQVLRATTRWWWRCSTSPATSSTGPRRWR